MTVGSIFDCNTHMNIWSMRHIEDNGQFLSSSQFIGNMTCEVRHTKYDSTIFCALQVKSYSTIHRNWINQAQRLFAMVAFERSNSILLGPIKKKKKKTTKRRKNSLHFPMSLFRINYGYRYTKNRRGFKCHATNNCLPSSCTHINTIYMQNKITAFRLANEWHCFNGRKTKIVETSG